MAIVTVKASSSKWQRCIMLATLLFYISASSAQTEPPHAQLRTFAPGGIAIDWEHPNDGATSITLERENPSFTWAFVALVNSFNDLGLQPRGWHLPMGIQRGQESRCRMEC